VPEPGRDTASVLINGTCLVDTGWNPVARMRACGHDPHDVHVVLITHGHPDHYLGLAQLFFYLWQQRGQRSHPQPPRIIGPAADIQLLVDRTLAFLQADRLAASAPRPEVVALSPGQSYACEAFELATCQTLHPVQGLCYRFTDRRTGCVVVITGDTAYHPPIAEHAAGADLLVHEATAPGTIPPDGAPGHCGAEQAARIAKAAGAGMLALVHGQAENIEQALARARAIFPETIWPADGQSLRLEAGRVRGHSGAAGHPARRVVPPRSEDIPATEGVRHDDA